MKRCAVDLETQPFDPKAGVHLMNTRFVCGAIADDEDTYYFTDVGQLSDKLSTYDVVYIHNSSFDLAVLKREGYEYDFPERVRDTMIMGFLLDENNPVNLNDLSKRYLGREKLDIGLKKTKNPPKELATIEQYVRVDADLCYNLGLLFEERLKEQGLLDLLGEIDLPFRRAMDQMTDEGVRVDLDRVQAEIGIVTARTDVIKDKYIRQGININSCKQVPKLLYYFPELVKKQKDGTPKTDEKTLLSTNPAYLRPEAAEIMAYRKDIKVLSTFLEGLKNAVLPSTGLMHPLYNITVAKTGRTSSGGSRKSYPYSFNIQNVAKDNRVVRGSIIAKEGTSLVVIDAKELELRVLAHYSQDPGLIKVFTEGIDAHRYTASLLFNKSMEVITKAERATAKTLNFATLYGTTAYGLTYSLGLSLERAEELIQRFYAMYPSIKNLKDEVSKRLSVDGYVKSLYGRRRRGPELNEKEAFAAYIQGTAADLMKECHVGAIKKLPSKYRPFLFVHDEFGYYVPEADGPAAVREIPKAYEESHRPLAVPILFTADVRKTWGKE